MNQAPIKNNGVDASLLAADGETDSETRRIHSRTRGTVNATVVEIVDALGNQITTFGSSMVTANQGTPAAIANAWPVYPADASGNILVANKRIVTAPHANNAGTPVDTTIYNATQSVVAIGIGAYPT